MDLGIDLLDGAEVTELAGVCSRSSWNLLRGGSSWLAIELELDWMVGAKEAPLATSEGPSGTLLWLDHISL